MIAYEFTTYCYNHLGFRTVKKIYVLANSMEEAIKKYNKKYPKYFSYGITSQFKIDIF